MSFMFSSPGKTFCRVDVWGGFWYNRGVKTPYLNTSESQIPVLLVLLSILVCGPAGEAAELPRLTSLRQVRELLPEQAAQGYPALVRGVVTFCDANADMGLFLQDGPTAIYVKLGEGTNVNAGDQVEIEGRTQPGDYVPMIYADHVRFLGRSALPTADPVGYEQLASGKEDCQWVEVQGVVRSVIAATKDRTSLDLMLNGQRLSALVGHLDMAKAQEMVCATVRLRGVCRTRFNKKRQIRAPYLSVTGLSNMVVEIPAPSEIAQVPLASLLQFNSEGYYGRRVKVQGVVTEQKENSLFIQDGGASLYATCGQADPISPGDIVQVIGFPVLGQYAPMLEDAIFHVVGHQAQPMPVNVRIDQLPSEDYDTVLVRLRGRLINRIQRADEQILVIEATNLILNARLNLSKADNRFTALQDGSELELTGVCLAQPVDNWNPSLEYRPEAFQLLLRSSDDVTVIRNPPWWTLSRLLWTLGIMSVVLLAGFAWVFALDRKVRQQTTIIQEKLRREAVLEERTRIAREFHDTLEQELVAITIQLEIVAAQFDDAPRMARQMLELARNMTRRSLDEARRSVWDLRSHLLQNSNLPTAVSEVTKLMAASARIPISVETSGVPRKLSLQVETNLLRIAQEALANAMKHSHASRIEVTLAYEPDKVRLRVSDDGIGFEADRSAAVFGGHFGLLDMSERAEKIGGAFTLISAPGQGTEIRVEVAEKEGAVPVAALEAEFRQEVPAA
jgi:signal transduction histidine kinase